MILCSQYIVPVTSDPFFDGAILVRHGQIMDIGDAEMLKMRYPEEEVRDFGQAALVPGFIDLYSHLEFSVMRGVVPDLPYARWVEKLRNVGAQLDVADWRASCVLGGLEALANGITCLGDISITRASSLIMQRLGLRGVVYREVGVMDKRRVDAAIKSAQDDIFWWSENVESDRIQIGIAPRESYWCHPSIYTRASEVARKENIPLAITIASSRDEYQFIQSGGSTLAVDRMDDGRGFVEVPPWLPTGVSPVAYASHWGAFDADVVTAAHCIHVDNEDIVLLREAGAAVAACPRCNAQLSMGAAPLIDLLKSGLTVGFGTGFSVAVDTTDLLSEMRLGMLIQRALNPGVDFTAKQMLRMGTIEAARALKLDDKIGSLEVGKCADIIAVDFSGSHQALANDPESALINTCTGADVLMTMVDGHIRYEKDKWDVNVEVAKDIARVIEIRGKLREKYNG